MGNPTRVLDAETKIYFCPVTRRFVPYNSSPPGSGFSHISPFLAYFGEEKAAKLRENVSLSKNERRKTFFPLWETETIPFSLSLSNSALFPCAICFVSYSSFVVVETLEEEEEEEKFKTPKIWRTQFPAHKASFFSISGDPWICSLFPYILLFFCCVAFLVFLFVFIPCLW